MYKFAGKVVDISDDVSMSTLSKEIKDKSFPDEFKKLTILSPEELEILPDNDFALIFVSKDGDIYRKFPMPNLDNAIVSSIYLMKSYNELPSEAAATAANNLLDIINKASDKYSFEVLAKITSPLRDIATLSKTQGNIYREPKNSEEDRLRRSFGDEIRKEKTARAQLKDTDFALVAYKDGKKHRLFQIDTAENMQKAASYFDSNYKLLSPEQRHCFAKSLRNKVIETGVKVASEHIAKYASSNWSPNTVSAIESRIKVLLNRSSLSVTKTAEVTALDLSRHIDDSQAITALRALQKLASKMDIDKFAMTLYNIDKSVSLDKCYGKLVTDAFESTYDGKIAAFGSKGHDLASLTTMFAGIPITASQLKSLDVGDLGGLLDENTYTELMKDPIAVFDSLPIPYKSAIVEAIKGPRM